MTQFDTKLAGLRRPRTLIRAARIGATRYRRNRDLKFLSAQEKSQSTAALMTNLIAYEDNLETNRKSGAGDYNVTQHVAVLTALIAEARAFSVPQAIAS